MNVKLRRISGYADAITCMYHSKRTWTPELEDKIYDLERENVDYHGKLYIAPNDVNNEFNDMLKKTCNMSKKHITLLRFIDISFTVEGLHRGAQDDFDAHAKRLDNRIIRSSTRLATFGNEKSEWYGDKILTFDDILPILGVTVPKSVKKDGHTYVRTVNGYIREDLQDNKDAKRGLYMLSIPSNFTAKCNITEFAHIVKLRDKNSHANPELRDMIEKMLVQIEDFCPLFTRELFYAIEN